MPRLRIRLAHAQPQRELTLKLGVGEKQVSAAVQAVHDALIGGVSGFVPETNQVQWCGSSEFKAVVVPNPIREFLRQAHVLADVMLQTLDAIMPDHEPQFQ